MTPRSAYTLFLVLGFVLVLAALGYALHLGDYEPLLVKVLGGIGLYLLIANLWALEMVADPDTPEPALGAGAHAVVFGFLLLLGLITLQLLQWALPPRVMIAIGLLGALLIVLGFAVIIGNLPPRPRYTAAMSAGAVHGDGRYGMSPHGACTLFVVLGTLLILYAVGHALHFTDHDPTLVGTLAGVGVFLILLAGGLLRRTGVVRIVRTYPHLAGATLLVVVGFGVILAHLTLMLMDYPLSVQQGRILLIIGGLLLALGLLLNGAGKRVIRLQPS